MMLVRKYLKTSLRPIHTASGDFGRNIANKNIVSDRGGVAGENITLRNEGQSGQNLYLEMIIELLYQLKGINSSGNISVLQNNIRNELINKINSFVINNNYSNNNYSNNVQINSALSSLLNSKRIDGHAQAELQNIINLIENELKKNGITNAGETANAFNSSFNNVFNNLVNNTAAHRFNKVFKAIFNAKFNRIFDNTADSRVYRALDGVLKDGLDSSFSKIFNEAAIKSGPDNVFNLRGAIVRDTKFFGQFRSSNNYTAVNCAFSAIKNNTFYKKYIEQKDERDWHVNYNKTLLNKSYYLDLLERKSVLHANHYLALAGSLKNSLTENNDIYDLTFNQNAFTAKNSANIFSVQKDYFAVNSGLSHYRYSYTDLAYKAAKGNLLYDKHESVFKNVFSYGLSLKNSLSFNNSLSLKNSLSFKNSSSLKNSLSLNNSLSLDNSFRPYNNFKLNNNTTPNNRLEGFKNRSDYLQLYFKKDGIEKSAAISDKPLRNRLYIIGEKSAGNVFLKNYFYQYNSDWNKVFYQYYKNMPALLFKLNDRLINSEAIIKELRSKKLTIKKLARNEVILKELASREIKVREAINKPVLNNEILSEILTAKNTISKKAGFNFGVIPALEPYYANELYLKSFNDIYINLNKGINSNRNTFVQLLRGSLFSSSNIYRIVNKYIKKNKAETSLKYGVVNNNPILSNYENNLSYDKYISYRALLIQNLKNISENNFDFYHVKNSSSYSIPNNNALLAYYKLASEYRSKITILKYRLDYGGININTGNSVIKKVKEYRESIKTLNPVKNSFSALNENISLVNDNKLFSSLAIGRQVDKRRKYYRADVFFKKYNNFKKYINEQIKYLENNNQLNYYDSIGYSQIGNRQSPEKPISSTIVKKVSGQRYSLWKKGGLRPAALLKTFAVSLGAREFFDLKPAEASAFSMRRSLFLKTERIHRLIDLNEAYTGQNKAHGNFYGGNYFFSYLSSIQYNFETINRFLTAYEKRINKLRQTVKNAYLYQGKYAGANPLFAINAERKSRVYKNYIGGGKAEKYLDFKFNEENIYIKLAHTENGRETEALFNSNGKYINHVLKIIRNSGYSRLKKGFEIVNKLLDNGQKIYASYNYKANNYNEKNYEPLKAIDTINRHLYFDLKSYETINKYFNFNANNHRTISRHLSYAAGDRKTANYYSKQHLHNDIKYKRVYEILNKAQGVNIRLAGDNVYSRNFKHTADTKNNLHQYNTTNLKIVIENKFKNIESRLSSVFKKSIRLKDKGNKFNIEGGSKYKRPESQQNINGAAYDYKNILINTEAAENMNENKDFRYIYKENSSLDIEEARAIIKSIVKHEAESIVAGKLSKYAEKINTSSKKEIKEIEDKIQRAENKLNNLYHESNVKIDVNKLYEKVYSKLERSIMSERRRIGR